MQFTSRNFWRNWEGYEYVSRRFEVAPLSTWQPAFGRLSDTTRAALTTTFTPAEIGRLQFATYLASSYQLNEG